jgi:hypothetical protein
VRGSDKTINDYISARKKLYVLEGLDAVKFD